MSNTDYDEFTEHMKSIYFASKRNRSVPALLFTGYLNTLELDYRTLYRARKWTKSKADPNSVFYASDPRDRNGDQGNPGEYGNDRDTSGVRAGEGCGLGSGHGCEHRGARSGRSRGRGFQRNWS